MLKLMHIMCQAQKFHTKLKINALKFWNQQAGVVDKCIRQRIFKNLMSFKIIEDFVRVHNLLNS